VGPRRWSAVIVGFIGVLIIVQPDAGGFDAVSGIALAATVLYALVIITIRQMSRTETTAAIIFYYSLASIVVSGVTLPFIWVTPAGVDWLLLVGLGLIGGVAQITMTNAYRFADAALVAPFDYTTVIWAALLGFVIWNEVPATSLWLGVAILMMSGLYILLREAQLGLPRGIARRFQTRR
jgi:drug/metabolite transporter (DMT)-like permease